MLGLKRIRELERQNAALVSIITDLREAIEAKEDEAASERRRRIELNERFINYKSITSQLQVNYKSITSTIQFLSPKSIT